MKTGMCYGKDQWNYFTSPFGFSSTSVALISDILKWTQKHERKKGKKNHYKEKNTE